jgi:hypothetical protein
MSVIEPLAQSDRANSNSSFSDWPAPNPGWAFFARPDILLGERKRHDCPPGILRRADYGNLSKLQKRDGNNSSYADPPRRRLWGCHLQMQKVPLWSEAHLQTTVERVGTRHIAKFFSTSSTKRVLSAALEMTRVSLGLIDNFANGIIAKRISEIAATGERDPDLLCEGAVKKLRGHLFGD